MKGKYAWYFIRYNGIGGAPLSRPQARELSSAAGFPGSTKVPILQLEPRKLLWPLSSDLHLIFDELSVMLFEIGYAHWQMV